ncbi:ATP-dependent helicase [Kamptonema sp. UHCC 0994]|uniref:UvrD-helicase domain-containing protein n=1 Tax=Kamptonema sp. UHCC 0994 TaxID=3031329 RepID=UPI0023B8D9A4|nr:ATP-dependent helicase [Kamptonema sp. UHCC 0994]MDF0553113.1 ATP-dependent helicase [Kamptonema sp. UHCC 0994]
MKTSIYQDRIVDWAKNNNGRHCCVNAVAGSGKSTTLLLVAKALQSIGYRPSNIKIIVFGKANSIDLIKKFGREWESSINTLHSVGWQLIKSAIRINDPRNAIKSNKYKLLAQDIGLISKGGMMGDLRREGAIGKEDEFVKLLDLCRLTNQEPIAEVIEDLCDHFELSDIRGYSVVASAVAQVLRKGESLAKSGQSFDFTDQIWLPVKWQIPVRPYSLVLVDEAQDLNAAQLELALMLAGDRGRILAVGDKNQAIMGFAGADDRSFEKIVERLKPIELPLSICYRCPKSHIQLVKSLFPNIAIEASENAIDGKIESIFTNELKQKLRTGDMVISRKTAPLVSLCIKLISQGIAATVKGKAIGAQLKGDLQEIAKMPGFKSYYHFNLALQQYKNAKELLWKGKDNEEQLLENLTDKLDALQCIYSYQPSLRSISQLEDYIDSLFSDGDSPIILSTCHRAKGLEAERVFIIKPEDMPMVWRNQQNWQYQQEENLLYVALTRSKSELYIVGSPDWLEEESQQSDEVEDSWIQPSLLDLIHAPALSSNSRFDDL